jgi:hypothetical protein
MIGLVLHLGVECRPGGVLQRLLPQPGGRILNQPVQPFVARTGLKGVGNPDAGPALRRQVLNALQISLAKPWRRIELESQGIVGGVA